MWKQLGLEGVDAGRDRVKRLMHVNGIQDAKRAEAVAHHDRRPVGAALPGSVIRDFNATRPDELRVADFTDLRCHEARRSL